ncbi:terminase small subunit [Desulfovibrio subterraneus]|jgi:phage terminase Nu1 subunit (DNA packaging protein)|uniref:Uncharacterized protein n=1 Tax=Desulfovibrio subterraneus TaxID=2718620 RepID=A0A7J0BLB0_9BACT|nr:terminase small subunit [Desulfovibrio subterraneus]GFM34041.1 hypothetical protein DSM101010T_24060 [Desulfovibrio subterraneus]
MTTEAKKKKQKKTESFTQVGGATVDMQGLALALGLSLPTIRTRLREGLPCVQQGGRGAAWVFDLAECVKWHTDRAVAKAVGDVGDEVPKAVLDRRLLVAQVRCKEIEAAKLSGEVAPIEEMERALTAAFVEVRQALLSIPERTALRLMAADDETEIKVILEEEIDLALNALSEADLLEKVEDAD